MSVRHKGLPPLGDHGYKRSGYRNDPDPAKVARILAAAQPDDPALNSRAKSYVDHTDHARLRGIPAIGRNVTGAVPGTRPEDCLR